MPFRLDLQGFFDERDQIIPCPQRVFEIGLEVTEETGAELTVGGEAKPVAIVAEVVAHGRNHTHGSEGAGKPVVGGGAIAFGHPLTILSAFVGAPITSLNPMIAAGWVAGLVQAWIKKPTVHDLEDLPNAISSVKGFWLNPVSRILLVVVLANLGSTLGTIISGIWIAERTL